MHYHSTYCVIEQLFDPEENDLLFLYSVFPHSHSSIVTIPDVSATLPICTLQEGSFVIVFVPNRFICLIDLSKPIRHFVFGREYAISPANENSAPIAVPRSFMSIFTGRIYSCRINWQRAIDLVGLANAEFVANCAARVLSSVTVTALFVVLERGKIPMRATTVFRDFFRSFGNFRNIGRTDHRDLEREVRESSIAETVLGQLDQMEDDFPSAGEFSRTDFFWWTFGRKIARQTGEDAATIAVKTMALQLKQNAVVSALDDALRTWKSETDLWRFVMTFVLSQFVQAYSFPRIPSVLDPAATLAMIEPAELRRSLTDFFREEKAAVVPAKPKKESLRASSLPDPIELEDLSSLFSMG
jgi:hypothetical protein